MEPADNGLYTLNNGNKLPALALGTMTQVGDECIQNIKQAIKIGYRSFDTSSCYGNEQSIGQGIKECIEEGIVKREELYITTRLWVSDYSPEKIRPACVKSLENLQLDYADLYSLHWPMSGEWDFTSPFKLTFVPMHKVWPEMERLVEEGLARNIGVCNFGVQMLIDLLSYAKIKPVINQIELHPYHASPSVVSWCSKYGILNEAYTPTGLGFAAFRSGNPTPHEDEVIKSIADRLGKTPMQIVLAWGISRGTRILPKSASEQRLKENFEASKIKLSQEDIEAINNINKNQRVADGEKILGVPITQ